MARAKPTTLDLGSVSTGTLRTEDLLPAVLTALDPRWIHLSRGERATVQRIDREYRAVGGDDDDADDDLQDLYDIADNHCPDYCTFGSHPGDGADIGVWPIEDLFDDDHPGGFDGYIGRGETAPIDPELTHWIQVSDHGNATLYRRAGSRWIVCWSIV
jgi:hypothetical protein